MLCNVSYTPSYWVVVVCRLLNILEGQRTRRSSPCTACHSSLIGQTTDVSYSSGLVQGSAPNEDLQNTTISAQTQRHKYYIKVAATSI